jgi:dTDP-4-amino-4,6-dideoxygalactose transaminase
MTRRNIQLFKPIFNKGRVLAEIEDCLDKGWTGIGYKTDEIEEKWKEYSGFKNAHFLNSATSGLHLALELAKRKRKHLAQTDVITTPLTFVSTNHAIVHAGLEPCFVDIDPATLCLSYSKVKQALKFEGSRILAVIYVALGGNAGHYDEIRKMTSKLGVPLILDAAHAAGSRVKGGEHLGKDADYTIFSFQAVKNLPTADSGMLCCLDERDDTLARKLSWLGISKNTWDRTKQDKNWEYDVSDIGWKYHGNSIMASIALAQLPLLEVHNSIRRLIAAKYYRGLCTYYGRVHITNSGSSYHLYQVVVNKNHRDKIVELAREKGVQLGVHYKPSNSYPCYGAKYEQTPMADEMSKMIISLPIGVHLTESDIEYVIEVMNNARDMVEAY